MEQERSVVKLSNQQDRTGEIVLPRAIYHFSLKTINEIAFTQREIDIIACMLNGRTTKKIASLLFLAPKTIENHIRNIRLKLKGGGAQENIIDFIENSNKFSVVKKYYSSLMIQARFELELKKISAMMPTRKENLLCLIVHHKEQKDQMTYINQLKIHLDQIGITTLIEVKEEHNALNDFTTQIQAQKVNRILYSLSETFIKRLENNDPLAKLEFFELTKKNSEKLNAITFLLLADNTSITVSKQFNEVDCINLATEGNYYNLFFKLLKRLWPNTRLEKNILEFKIQRDKFHESSFHKTETHENAALKKQYKGDWLLNVLSKKKWWTLSTSGLICLIFFYAGSSTKIKNNSIVVDNNTNHYNAITNFEAKEICKVPEPCEFFSGRTDFIKKIQAILKQNKKIVVVGYQGMGKTQVSYQYARQNAYEYEGGTYIFKADSEQSLINSIRAFAIVMGIVTQSEGYRLNDDQVKKLIVPLLQDNLKNRKKMLFIFDNVNDYDSIRDLASIQSKEHHLVITSCSKKWDAWDILELREFDQEKEEAEGLILKVLKKETHQNAQKLASKLGYYPLAITQAINYLKNNNMIAMDDYIKEYDSLYERRKAFLSYHSFEQNHYIKTSLTAFEISKNRLVEELTDAYYLLKLCSHFSHDIIPVSIFKKDIKNIPGVLEVLNKYSMLDMININGELYLNMHNVLRDGIKIQIHEEKKENLIESKVLSLMDQYFIYDFWNKQNIEKIRLIIPHVEYFLNYLHKKDSPLLKTHQLINLLSKSGAYHIHCFRDTHEAIRLLEKAKYLAQFIEPAPRELTNRIMEDLATSYYYHGEYNKARQEIQLVHKRKGTSALSFIIEGHILYNECRYDEAQIAYEKVLKLLEQNKNLQYLALANRSLGLVFYKKALFSPTEQSTAYINLSKRFLEKALEIQENFNSENLELAITKNAYGRTAIKLKELEKAEKALSEALRIAKDYCKKDEDNYETLAIKRSYGYYLCLYKKERFTEGIQHLKEALEGKFRIYQNKPHQAVIGTIERIVEVYALNPDNKELIKLIPTISQYLDDWALAEKSDHSKNLNNEHIGTRIREMKNVINKLNAERRIML
ncbi:MAG TPA: LuxR C-terminal-related transcriptional regulator [Gammaproteobacteria bacterium]|nr:LuxR C-terminal-related transcriptional regulator [Gammaproteobacteria bacterium]